MKAKLARRCLQCGAEITIDKQEEILWTEEGNRRVGTISCMVCGTQIQAAVLIKPKDAQIK